MTNSSAGKRIATTYPRQAIDNSGLIILLIRREIAARYRGSVLGILWSLITPLLMLAVYTFVFGYVLKARWPSSLADGSTLGFGTVLFAGLIVFQLFAEVISRAPTLVVANPSYVKKVIFPLSTLVPVALGTALFHCGVSLAALFLFMLFERGGMPVTVLWLPVILAPSCLLIMGLAWLLASLGVFFRDLSQFIGTLMTVLLFMSPVFFSVSTLPPSVQFWIGLNPISFPVEQVRAVLLLSSQPRWSDLAIYSVCSIFIAALGYCWFQRTRKGFADVL